MSSSVSSHIVSRAPVVIVIGAGRLGTALARALAAGGYRIAAVVARRASRAAHAASLISSQTQPLAASRLSELPPADILLITTPDDTIAATAARLAWMLQSNEGERAGASSRAGVRDASLRKGKRAASPHHVALHASGALSSDVLAPLRARGYQVGSMHPLVSVVEPVSGAESLRRAFFCVEGDARAVRTARSLVRSLGAQSFTVATKEKALYHAAAVMTSGHTVALFDLASELLTRCGLTAGAARRVLLPLLQSTLDNLTAQKTPARALTGTFARADVATVRRHLAALKSQPAALDVYALLGQRSLRLAAATDARDDSLREIRRALDEVLED